MGLGIPGLGAGVLLYGVSLSPVEGMVDARLAYLASGYTMSACWWGGHFSMISFSFCQAA